MMIYLARDQRIIIVDSRETAPATADIGAVQAVIIAPRDQSQFGGADKRRIGSVVSVRRDEIKGN